MGGYAHICAPGPSGRITAASGSFPTPRVPFNPDDLGAW